MRLLQQSKLVPWLLVAVFVFLGAFAGIHVVFAQQAGLETAATAAGFGPQNDIRVIIARIIRAFLGFLGAIVMILIIYAGYLWMTAAGDEKS